MKAPSRAARARLAELAEARLAIEGVDPEIDGGRLAAKCVAGRPMPVEADILCDGHEVLGAEVVVRPEGAKPGQGGIVAPMALIENDRWGAEVTVPEPGPWTFTIRAWRDLFGTWHRDAGKKIAAGQDVSVELQEGLILLERVSAKGEDARAIKALAKAAKSDGISALMGPDAVALMKRVGPRGEETGLGRDVPLWCDRERAAFGAWYELFPRSLGKDGRHGTFRDVIGHLPYVQGLGFDTLYFPPIHPIGRTNRKGKNNTLTAGPDDVGSPYATGAKEGGHDAVHPELGTLEDFAALVKAAREHGLEIAIDVALNASPDHPWIEAHPDWFERRPDGTIKYAENPPKKYEDIVNFRYYLDDGQPNAPYWTAVRDMFLIWAERGVLSFRVDNPHTKPLPFWQWIIEEVRARHPGAIFLSEAFTKPKMMKRLAKVGFNQSYSYFTWRDTKWDFTEYLTELTLSEARHVMRPNFFVNTPDINPIFTQTSGRPGFRTKAVLAATLSPCWGLYSGFELCEAAPLPGKEEYLDSEKYELRPRDFDAPGNITDDVRLLNRLRAENPALQHFTNLTFEVAHDERVLAYAKHDPDGPGMLLFHVLLDPRIGSQFGFEIPLWRMGLPDDASVEVQDMIHGNRFTWHGKGQSLTLDPEGRPYAIWKLIPPGGAR